MIKKNTAFLDFLLESGVSDFHETTKTIFNPDKTIPTPKTSNQVRSLDELRQHILNFSTCSLKKYAKNTVFGEGIATKPLLMCIGEAPGEDEDRLGRPFVGKPGQLLDKMLASIGLSRETNTYITNVIPWRPPGNRTPTTEEISLCRPFVLNEIELVQPRFILFLGSSPTHALTEKTEGISKLRGQWIDLKGIKALPTYHPTYLLRSPEKKKEAWADLLKLKNCLFS